MYVSTVSRVVADERRRFVSRSTGGGGDSRLPSCCCCATDLSDVVSTFAAGADGLSYTATLSYFLGSESKWLD